MSKENVAIARPLNQLLRMAVMAGVESAVRIHIDRGDDLNARDASGMTPLMLSAARDKPAICSLLLKAGADHGLLDPSGKTALEIAIAAGSKDTAAILGAVHAPISSVPIFEIAFDPAMRPLIQPSPSDPFIAPDVMAAAGASASMGALELEETAASPEPELGALQSSAIEMDEGGEFDLSIWEAEHEATPPEADLVVLDSASAIQSAITLYKPIDSSAEWDEIDAYLPEQALPLARVDNSERRALLRRLLLRAIREGSVPSLDVEAQSTNEDRSANPEAEAYLTMVVNDLGAEVDERFEYANVFESFEVFVDPEETPDEEMALDEALGAIDRAASLRHLPLQIYQREFQPLRLLSAEEEVQLAQSMEASLDAALDALAVWPEGIARTLAAGAEAIAGSRPLSSIWLGVAEPDPDPASAESLDAGISEDEVPEDTADEDAETAVEIWTDAAAVGFADALRRLDEMAERAEAAPYLRQEVRQALAALRLNRRFLLELSDAASGSASCPVFGHALASFREVRDQMATANLKLAFFHARKYLYSGEALDDLAQEGNIGLLKAVDRFDWRRGFRFSTYATWWIRQQISRYIFDKSKTIRLPVHIHQRVQRMERVVEAFEKEVGRKPTLDELSERMDLPPPKVAALLRIAPEPIRIDELPVDEMIAVDSRDSYKPLEPADVVDKIQLDIAVARLISSLSTKDGREEQVLRLRFGIGVEETMTLNDVGMRFSVTRERIRQIEVKALEKLRHPVRSEPFALLALGVRPKPGALDFTSEEYDRAEVAEAADEAHESMAAKPDSTPWPSRESIQWSAPPNSSGLDRLLAQAVELGILVEDGRARASGRIWVNLGATPDKLHRTLARKLLEFGFEHSPGKGYWR